MKMNWGAQQLPVGQRGLFTLGPLSAAFERSDKDWRVEYGYPGSALSPHDSETPARLRSVFRETRAEVDLRPACADRSVVAMPVDTLRIPVGEKVTIYISSPVWVQTFVRGGEFLLADFPSEPLSDTWFGPNTREGELSYSSASNARVFLDQLPVRQERLVTPVVFVNEGEDAVNVDRVNLPLPLLSVFQAREGMWTQEVTITRHAALAEADLEFTAKPPSYLSDAKKMSEPRESESEFKVTRALSMLFS